MRGEGVWPEPLVRVHRGRSFKRTHLEWRRIQEFLLKKEKKADHERTYYSELIKEKSASIFAF